MKKEEDVDDADDDDGRQKRKNAYCAKATDATTETC